MAKSLVEKLRQARQVRVESLGKVFIARRPTDLEASGYSGGRLDGGNMVTRFVTGWEGFTEADFIEGGSDEEVPFSELLFVEYIADHPEHWPAISEKITEHYKQFKQKREAAEKNSPPGLSA